MKFDLAICTSTGTHHQAQLYEWIEYHRLLGVQHFFIYDRHMYKSHARRHAGNITSARDKIRVAAESGQEEEDDQVGGGDDDDDTVKFTESSVYQHQQKLAAERLHPETQESLEALLEDFIDAGVVTVVPWPYKDCTDHMSCDYPVKLSTSTSTSSSSNSGSTTTHDHDKPLEVPRRLQHHAAVASCYQRFRPFASWCA